MKTIEELRKLVDELSNDPEKRIKQKIENGKRDAQYGRLPVELSGPYYDAYQYTRDSIKEELWNSYSRKQNEYT